MINKSEVAETITLFINKMGIIFVVEEKNIRKIMKLGIYFGGWKVKIKITKKKWKIKFSFVFEACLQCVNMGTPVSHLSKNAIHASHLDTI